MIGRIPPQSARASGGADAGVAWPSGRRAHAGIESEPPNAGYPGAKTPHIKIALECKIAATDAQMDRLVCQLYGLVEEEIKIVEGAGA